jgi:hypothetical protein
LVEDETVESALRALPRTLYLAPGFLAVVVVVVVVIAENKLKKGEEEEEEEE